MPERERISLDVHAHLAPVFPAELAEVAGVSWNAQDRALIVDGHRVGMRPLFDPEALIAWMDGNQVARAWISIPPPLYRMHLQGDAARQWVKYVNMGLRRIADRFPSRLSPLSHLPLQAPEIALEVVTTAMQHGHRRFAAPAGGDDERVLSDTAYEPLWSALNEAKAFVFFHPGECADGRLSAFYLSNLLGNPYETAVAIAHLAFGGVFERYPDITFCFAHGGGVAPMVAGRLQRGFETAREGIDLKRLAPRRLFRNVCVDCITHDEHALALSEQVFGKTHVLFGSDWPFPMGLPEPHLQLQSLEAARRRRIFCDNPERLMKEKG